MNSLRTAGLALAALLLAGACGGGDDATAPVTDRAALAPGACRSAAPLLDRVTRDVSTLRDDKAAAGSVRAGLASAQSSLAALPSPGPAAASMTELGQALGFLRLGIDTHSFSPATLDRVDAAVSGTVKACRPA